MQESREVEMTISERRRRRRRLYELIAMMHSGPLGFDLISQTLSLAQELYAIDSFSIPISKPDATMFYKYQNNCVGNRELHCLPNSLDCFIAKFMHMARSSSKGASKRRLTEADYIYEDLLPCLNTKLISTKSEAYKELLIFTKEIIIADAEYNKKYQCPNK